MKVTLFTMRVLLAYLFCAVLWGCALPSSAPISEKFVSSYEREVESLVREGLFFSQQGRYVEAEFNFRKALFALPQSERILFNLGVALERQRVFQEAEQIYRTLLRRNPTNVRVQLALGRLYVAQLSYDNAIRVYEGVERQLMKPVSIDEVQLEADRPLRVGEFAEPEHREALVSTYRSLSSIYFRLGNEEQSMCYSTLALETSQNAPLEKVRHARLLLSRGLSDNAVEMLGDVLIKNDIPPVLHVRALLHYDAGEKDEARSLCLELLRKKELPSATERDCMWIVALVDDFQVYPRATNEFPEELQPFGLELAFRRFDADEEALFLPVTFVGEILRVERGIVPELFVEENETSEEVRTETALFALPREYDEQARDSLESTFF
ncbi:MAG: tetratricopeptide repeat protein [Bdellovibrionales bacterium]|nr:tetratricopeptide repeat protein [Bdellovibrionales bacterium]